MVFDTVSVHKFTEVVKLFYYLRNNSSSLYGSKKSIYLDDLGELVLYHVNLVFGQLSSTVKFRSKICFQASYEPENWI